MGPRRVHSQWWSMAHATHSEGKVVSVAGRYQGELIPGLREATSILPPAPRIRILEK